MSFNKDKNSPWVGVDLDGTLAKHLEGRSVAFGIGEPIPIMVARVKYWLENGMRVKIFTARVGKSDVWSEQSKSFGDQKFIDNQIWMINNWCRNVFGEELEITSEKDFLMTEFWDDRAVRVELNTGRRIV